MIRPLGNGTVRKIEKFITLKSSNCRINLQNVCIPALFEKHRMCSRRLKDELQNIEEEEVFSYHCCMCVVIFTECLYRSYCHKESAQEHPHIAIYVLNKL